MNKKTICTALFTAGLIFSHVASAADDDTVTPNDSVNSSTTTVTTTNDESQRNHDRFVRRIIAQASALSAGYDGSDANHYSNPSGYDVGVTLDLIGTENLVLELGALYRQLGTVVNYGFADNSLQSNYIVVPLDAKYYFSGQEHTSLYFKIGVAGATLTSNNNVNPSPTTTIGSTQWEIDGLAGLGVKINMTASTDFLIEADYDRAFQPAYQGTNNDVYRSDLGVALGVAFNL